MPNHDEKLIFILSAPSPWSKFNAAIVPYDACHGLQILLGWEAQLRTFATAARKIGARCFVTPAPEMFFSQVTLELLAPRAGLTAHQLSRAIHVRFGPARFCRILRGMTNLLANAETMTSGIIPTGAHPFRHHNVAPFALQAAIDLSGQKMKLIRTDASEIQNISVPRALIRSDVSKIIPDGAPISARDFDGLRIASLVEFEAEEWGGKSGDADSPAARKMMLEHNVHSSGSSRPVILLPWNLANPVSGIPDLASKFHLRATGLGRAPYLLLLPYNAGPAGLAAVSRLSEDINELLNGVEPEVGNLVRNFLLVARVTNVTGAATLRRMAAAAWIDGTDPEADWTSARFESFGLRVSRLQTASEDINQGRFAVLADAPSTEINDEFGRRFIRSSAITMRGLDRMIRLAGEGNRESKTASSNLRQKTSEMIEFFYHIKKTYIPTADLQDQSESDPARAD